MQRRTVLGTALLSLGGCTWPFQKSWTIRYRLDVYLHSPAQQASTVIETAYDGPTQSFGFPSTYLYRTRTWGDAPSFETSGGGRLFATFSNGEVLARAGDHYFAPTQEQTLVSVLPNADDVEAYRAGRLFDELETMTGPRDLPPEQWPRLFWLANENDLSTTRFAPRPSIDYGPQTNVAPLKPLADILGPGADIAGVTIERTDAPISKDLHRRFS